MRNIRAGTPPKCFYDLYDSNEDGSGSGGTGISGEPLDEHGWAEAKDMTAEEVKELEREIDAAIRQGNLLGSKLGSGGARLFGDLLAPQINWKDVLLDFVMTTCQGTDESTWRRPNRRFAAHDMYMPIDLFRKALRALCLQRICQALSVIVSKRSC
jgi:hypothetical protein